MTLAAQDTKEAAACRLEPYFARLAVRPAWRWSGRVVEANGQTVESEGPLCSVGECCEILDQAGIGTVPRSSGSAGGMSWPCLLKRPRVFATEIL
jgi:hypothetical protein